MENTNFLKCMYHTRIWLSDCKNLKKDISIVSVTVAPPYNAMQEYRLDIYYRF